MVAAGERSGWWAGFRALCLGWRLVGSWIDGWVKGWESKVVGFGWSGPQLECPVRVAEASSNQPFDVGLVPFDVGLVLVAAGTQRCYFRPP